MKKLTNWIAQIRENREWYRNEYVVIGIWLPVMIAIVTYVTVNVMLLLGEVFG